MDVRNAKWHGQLTVTGVGTPKNHSGSVMAIVAESLKDLQELSPRALSNGEQEIVIRIRSKPFGAAKESLDHIDKISEVEAGLDDSDIDHGPREGETYQAFCERLESTGIPHAAVLMIAADWFAEVEAPTQLKEWLSDRRAIRFRQLNASDAEFEKATPEEYEALKHYVRETYPSFVEQLTFRTA